MLAMDTSSAHGVVGVVSGNVVLSERLEDVPGASSEGLLPMVRDCLDGAHVGLREIDAIVVGRGPGSFTGTRMALATAKGFALGLGIPIVSVSSIEAAALDAGVDGIVAIALDAKKGEFLVAAYRCGPSVVRVGGREMETRAAMPVLDPMLCALERAMEAVRGIGADRVIGIPGDAGPLISGPLPLCWVALARMSRGERDDPDTVEPVYSRPPPGG